MHSLKHRIEPIEAAQQFVDHYFPNCQAAGLAGSVVRGEATETSDLDIVVFDQTLVSSYRESLIEYGWRIELFAHNLTSYHAFFVQDCQRAMPSLPTMVAESVVLKDTGVIEAIKREAKDLLERGPDVWSDETIEMKRYFLTDVLDDLIGCQNRQEGLFISSTIGDLICEFILRTNGKWTGTSKWAYRALARHDNELAHQLAAALESYYRNNEIDDLVCFVDEAMLPFGGRLFAGFSRGKSKET
ncbi:nucleotidyltransferase [Exiguobacterium sp. S17]|nr:nucleotidyltransferase [Exiguobacterium sp. S17]